MHNKNGTLETIVANFEQQGVDITEQAVAKRFTDNAANFFKQLIAQACMLLVSHDPEKLPLLQRFHWLMLFRGGRLGEVSPTKLYRQVSQVIPDIAEALWNGDADALTATLHAFQLSRKSRFHKEFVERKVVFFASVLA